MLIGTFCIENKIPLLHNDRDFETLEELGLQVVIKLQK
jgi:predicted nucleic acid-binding protein